MCPFSIKAIMSVKLIKLWFCSQKVAAKYGHHHASICTSELIPSSRHTNGKSQGNTLHHKYGVPSQLSSLWPCGGKPWYCFVHLQY